MTTGAPKAGVIGWPIRHSRSPLIHGHWLKVHAIAGSYVKEAVAPEDLKAFIGSLAARGWRGCNVTFPHKEAVLAAASVADEVARAIGAANTLWVEGGHVHATNTDAYGFMTHLERSAPDWREKDRPAVVIGAGGAARAILHGLLEAGVSRIRLSNRTRERAEGLAATFGRRVDVADWGAWDKALHGAGLIVNTTSLGMAGQPALEIDLGRLPSDAVVSDIVYVPLQTPLLAQAAGLGFATVDGLGMLLHQAVPGFARWFGVRPEVSEELRSIIARDIEGG
jgi:shikimate dehydrogenase